MITNDHINLFIQFILYIKDILLGAVGGAVAYLLQYKKYKEVDALHTIQWSLLVVNMVLGGFIASIIGDIIPNDVNYHNFIVGSIGVASYPLLVLIENNIAKLVYERITNTKIEEKEDNEQQRTTKDV